MSKINNAINSLRNGKFVLIYDSDGRENETDLVINAEFVKPKDIAKMRTDGGGLICTAVGKDMADKLCLPFASDVHKFASDKFSILKYLKANDIPYDEKSSFSVSINHRNTFTGISDRDRALTISEFGKFCGNLDYYKKNFLKEIFVPNQKPIVSDSGKKRDIIKEFGSKFRSPGHVFLLKSSGLDNRQGHTELATAILEIGNLTPVAAICEMLDNSTHKSLSKEKAIKYAKENNIVLLETNEIINAYKKWQKLE